MNLLTNPNHQVGDFNRVIREFDAATFRKFAKCSVPEAVAVCENRAAAGTESKYWWRLALKIQDAARAVGLSRGDFNAAPELPEPMDFDDDKILGAINRPKGAK